MQQTQFGFGHYLAQADVVGQFLLALLLLMSVASWYLILTKSIAIWLKRRRSQRFIAFFRSAGSLDEVSNETSTHGAREPFAHLASHAIFARQHHRRSSAARVIEAGTTAEFLTRSMRSVIDEETARLESGLTALATVGATAPFVGLFGTVWGIYHALVAIGTSGSGTLDKVAGPVGEALLMTGLGLAVALPAVTAYNFLIRSNRMLLSRLDGFAHDLFAYLTTGEPLTRPLAGAATAAVADIGSVAATRAAGA